MSKRIPKIGRAQRVSEQTEVRPIPNHECQLPLLEDLAYYRIYQGLFVLCRRRLWKWMTVSPFDPQSKKYMKSAARIHEEEIRHLTMHPNVIHPFSQLRYAWEVFMLFVWGIQFFCIPVVIALQDENVGKFIMFYLVLCFFCHVDIMMWFFTGYYDHKKNMVVMKRWQVAVHYMFRFFLIDLVTAQPWSLYMDFVGALGSYTYYVDAILLLKLFRMPKLLEYLQRFSERTGIDFLVSHIKLITSVLWVVVVLMWTSSVTFMIINVIAPEDILTTTIDNMPLLMTTFRVARALMAVGITDKLNSANGGMFIEIFGLTLGTIIQIFVLAKVMQYYQKRSSSRNKYQHLLEEIDECMKYKELPIRLRNKIAHYIDFKFQKHIFREEDVLNNLSMALKHEILYERCQTMIEKVEFFKDLPPYVITRIVSKLRSEIFLPNDVVVVAGYTGHAMYFVSMGTVAMYTGGGKEICHLDDGSHFGEISLVINEPRVVTVVAVRECELLRLSRRDFQDAIEPFPDLYRQIRLQGMSQLENALQVGDEKTDLLVTSASATKIRGAKGSKSTTQFGI
ncbi:hypothetical protein Zmor_027602 [Zophobas morio]|uniref:Cyclic nucleotide-binding domain-containing protein n=1 Tax=Zophobas morio TaxID=2755281 RepID=A0AA38HQ52_9CUCU|nr:hypothetical protein Zmor_027602 [Zophobas morio]